MFSSFFAALLKKRSTLLIPAETSAGRMAMRVVIMCKVVNILMINKVYTKRMPVFFFTNLTLTQ